MQTARPHDLSAEQCMLHAAYFESWITKKIFLENYDFQCSITCQNIQYSVRMRKNTDQKNCEYGHFSRSVNMEL